MTAVTSVLALAASSIVCWPSCSSNGLTPASHCPACVMPIGTTSYFSGSSARNTEAAQKFVDYMLTTPAQQYFADQTFEYPMIAGVKTNDLLTPLAQLKKPDLDLSRLADLQATLALLRDVGLL